MTGAVLTYGGETWRLPPLISWDLRRTDGDPCDSASVTFPYEPARLEILKQAVRLRLTENGKTVFFGVVDEFTAEAGTGGRTVALSARSLAALLMDNQLRAAEFPVFQLSDALDRFVRPWGVTRVEAGVLPPVRNFAVETGTTCWQALCGFCRHSADLRPRFSADGTLMLKTPSPSYWELSGSAGVERAVFRHKRYGVISRQVLVDSRHQSAETADYAAFSAMGGSAQKVNLQRGKTTRATWRTAKQRIDDSARGAVTVTVTLPGPVAAEPGDRIRVDLPEAGIAGTFTLAETRDRCDGGKRTGTLELEGTIA